MPETTYREALNDALREEMQRDSSVFILGEDVGLYGGAFKITEGLYAEFGEKRVIDMPIAEGLIIGAANGQTVYIRATISDPFGAYDITAADIVIKNPASA